MSHGHPAPASASGQPPPDGLVWHYSDAAGLLSILSTGTLWATSSHFLNDAGEVGLGVQLLEAELRGRAGSGDAFYAQIGQLLDETGWQEQGPSPSMFFILSAAQHHDLLAMWRNYGGAGESYAVGLDPAAPLAVLTDEPVTQASARARQRPWEPVRYSTQDQHRLVDAVYDNLPAEAEWAHEQAGRGARWTEIMDGLGELLDDMEQALALIKHIGFADERETRHCTVVYRGPDRELPLPAGMVRYRPSRFGLAPYVVLTGCGEQAAPGGVVTARGPLPIRAVAISPSPNGLAAEESLTEVLLANGYGAAQVLRSAIPFRG